MSSYWANGYIVRKLQAIEYKGGKCTKCGYNEYYGALEFHHRNVDEKEFSWSTMRNKAWWKVLKELDKCDLMCSNCHKETHRNPKVASRALRWREELDREIALHKVTARNCPTCGKSFKPHQNKGEYCSKKCAGLGQATKINWPSDLPELVAAASMRKVGMQLRVSDKAVAKRLKQHHGV